MRSQKRIAKGHLCFRELGRMVMYLHSSQRVLSGQSRLATLLQGLRSENGHTLNDNDIEFLIVSEYKVERKIVTQSKEQQQKNNRKM